VCISVVSNVVVVAAATGAELALAVFDAAVQAPIGRHYSWLLKLHVGCVKVL
jgi:hypothetical protein